MAISKRATILSFTMLAALSLEIGCGDNNGNKRNSISHNIQARRGATPVVPGKTGATPATGTPSADGKKGTDTTSSGGVIKDPKVAAALATDLDNLAKIEAKENADGQPISREQLTNGTYSLVAVKSSYHYLNMGTGDEFRAVHDGSKLQNDNGQYSLPDTTNSNQAGTQPADEKGREFGAAQAFTLQGNGSDRWSDANLQAHEMNIFNVIIGGKLQDNTRKAVSLKASVVAMLATAQQDKDHNNLSITDDDGTPVSLQILHIDDQNIRIRMTFDEAVASDTDTSKKITKTRNIFLDYNLVPAQPTGGAVQTQTDPPTAGTPPPAPNAPPAEVPAATAAPKADAKAPVDEKAAGLAVDMTK